MTKKALVSTIEPSGKDNAGYRVLEVVDADNTFETDSNLVWYDCPDTVEMESYWYDPASSSFKKLPEVVDVSTVGELARDADGKRIEEYVWDWDNEVWTKVAI